MHEETDEVWNRVFTVYVDGMFRLTRAILPITPSVALASRLAASMIFLIEDRTNISGAVLPSDGAWSVR